MSDNSPTVCNISIKNLRTRNIKNFIEWNSLPDKLYIGRDEQRHVPGTLCSKWANKFSVKKYGREKCLSLYRKHILDTDLYDCLGELANKELGCWCKPNKCHGDILIELFREKFNTN